MLPLILHRQPRLIATMAAMFLAAEALAQNESVTKDDCKRRLVVSLSDRKIALIENDEVVRIYPVAVGKSTTPTPAGSYEIVNRVPDPTWYGPGRVVGPGKANPLGTRWIGLSVKGYGIHGTNRPGSIGKRASHGCIRMRNADVEDLFERISVGDSVELVDQLDESMARWFHPAEPATADAGA